MTSEFLYDDELVAWANDRIPDNRFRDDAHAIGHRRDGELVAVVVYDTFSTTNCFIHVAAEGRRWITKEFQARVFAYPFIQLGFPRVSCIVSVNNRASLFLTRQFGWRQEGVWRKAAPDGSDFLLFGMLRSECRFLPPMHRFSRRQQQAISRLIAQDVRTSAPLEASAS